MTTVNPHWLGYRCTVCERSHDPDWRGFVCKACGPRGILDAAYDQAAIARQLDPATAFPDHPAGGLWRFAPLLPFWPESSHPAWSVGDTPLLSATRLADSLQLAELQLKDDTGLPSGSLKDRATAVALVDAVSLGVDHLACASTGNAAASLATLAARAGLGCTICVPATAPEAKLAQLLMHGARVVRVDGDYDQAYELSLRALAKHGWYSRNCAHNPLLVEGKKTVVLEIARARGWQLPDAVFVPVGDGCIVSAVAKGLAELVEVGLADRLPRVYGVQAAGASPLATAWQTAGTRASRLTGPEILDAVQPVLARSCADSIAVGVPRNRVKAWRRVAATAGGFLTVTDEEILASVRLLAHDAGLFAEPSGATGLAGLIRARSDGLVADSESVVVLVTGHGLKDPSAALAGVALPEPIPPDSSLPR